MKIITILGREGLITSDFVCIIMLENHFQHDYLLMIERNKDYVYFLNVTFTG